MIGIDSLIGIGIIIFFALFVYAGIRKKPMGEVVQGIIDFFKGKKESAQEIINSVSDMGKQEWGIK